MEWPYPPEHRALRARVEELARAELAPRAARIDRESLFPDESLRALAAEGLLGLLLPARFEGLGLDRRAFALTTEALARACASTALVYAMHVCAAEVVLRAGSPAQHELVLGRIRRDGALGTVAISEPAAGDDFRLCLSQAEAVDGGVRLSAEKSFTTSAGHADWYVVETRTPGDPDTTSLDAYLVLADQAGVVAAPERNLGLNGDASGPLAFRDVLVPDAQRLGPPGAGERLNEQVLDPLYLLGTCAVWLGIAAAAFEQAVAHAAQRAFRDVGRRVSDDGARRAELARARVLLDALALAVGWYADALDRAEAGDPPPGGTLAPGWELKVLAADTVGAVTDIALVVTGAAGYRAGPIERLLRDGRAAALMTPSSPQCRELIGRRLVGLPLPVAGGEPAAPAARSRL